MKQILCCLFGSAKRILITGLVGLVLWGMVNPEPVRDLIATGWDNFWIAFGPLIQQLITLAIMGGAIWLLGKSLVTKKK